MKSATATVSPRPTGLHRFFWRATAPLRGMVVAGATSGFIAAGIGSRVVMLIIRLVDGDHRGVRTDSSAIVGDFTFSGTAGLLFLGTIAGIIGGIMYLGLRRWLFTQPILRGVAIGLITLFTIGQILFDTRNVDFQIFEPVLVVVALFALLFPLNGLILVALADRIHPEPVYPPGSRMPKAVAGVATVACLLGAIVMAGTVSTMIDDAGTCYAAVGGGEGCAIFTQDVAAP